MILKLLIRIYFLDIVSFQQWLTKWWKFVHHVVVPVPVKNLVFMCRLYGCWSNLFDCTSASIQAGSREFYQPAKIIGQGTWTKLIDEILCYAIWDVKNMI